MTVKAKRFWGAVLKSLYTERLRTRGQKVYYDFAGDELMVGDTVADVVRAIAETGMDQEYMVFKYVPSPSSMHAACWAALRGEVEDVSFSVRVHEKFTFPSLDRGTDMGESEARPSEALGAMTEQFGVEDSEPREDAVSECRNLADDLGRSADPEDVSDAEILCEIADELRGGSDQRASSLADELTLRTRGRLGASRSFLGL